MKYGPCSCLTFRPPLLTWAWARNGRNDVYRVSDLLDVQMSDELFERPEEFDLVTFWEGWCAEREGNFHDYKAVVRVAPDLLPLLPRYFGNHIQARIVQAGPPDGEGRIRLELSFKSFEAARERLLGFGRGSKCWNHGHCAGASWIMPSRSWLFIVLTKLDLILFPDN